MKNRRHAILLWCLSVVPAGCLEDPATTEIGTSAAALTPVTWTDVVGASAAGNDLTKTAPETAWNAGAASVQTLTGDGVVEFTTGEATAAKMAGLSSGNGGADDADIDFAIRLSETGRIAVLEGGINRGGFGTYVAGDVFRVAAEGGVVAYAKNGAVFYTSALAPSFPLLVDTSLRTPGATLLDVAIDEPPFWENVVRADALGRELTKTGLDSRWNAGASSVDSIPAGDGYIEFAVADLVSEKAAGLSAGDGGPRLSDIDFAIRLGASGQVSVYESGMKVRSAGTYVPTDLFQVEASGGVVTYFKNRIPIHTSSATPGFPLVLDASLYSPGASIREARIVAGRPLEDCLPYQQSIFGDEPGDTVGQSFGIGGDRLQVNFDSFQDIIARLYRKGASGWELDEELPFTAGISRDGAYLVRSLGITSRQIYRREGDQWVDDGIITACPGTDFGTVDLFGDLLVASVRSRDRAHVYRRGPDGWTLEAALIPDGGLYPYGEVRIAGNRVFLGNDYEGGAGALSGAINVFRYDPALPEAERASCANPSRRYKWRSETTLRPTNAGDYQYFPSSMDVDATGTRVLAGQRWVETVHVFELGASGWGETRLFTADPVKGNFGWTVALGGPGGTLAVVGAPSPVHGHVYVYGLRSGVWRQIAYFVGGEQYAERVAATADTVFISDRLDDQAGANAGALRIHGIDPVCLAE
jgi:hypothetical protein